MLKYTYEQYLFNLNILNTETGESIDLLLNEKELEKYKKVTGAVVEIIPEEI